MKKLNEKDSGFVVKQSEFPDEPIFHENIFKRFSKRRLKLLKIRFGLLLLCSLAFGIVGYMFKDLFIKIGLFPDNNAYYMPLIAGFVFSVFFLLLFNVITRLILLATIFNIANNYSRASIRTAKDAFNYSDELQDYFMDWLKSDTITTLLDVEKGTMGKASMFSIVTVATSDFKEVELDDYSVRLLTEYNLGDHKRVVSVIVTFNKKRNKLAASEYKFSNAVQHKPILDMNNNNEHQVIEKC